MKEKKRTSPVDASRELIIDSIVLTKDVLHSIRNNLPMPLDNIILQKIERTMELEVPWIADPNQQVRTLLLVSAAVLLAVLIVTL